MARDDLVSRAADCLALAAVDSKLTAVEALGEDWRYGRAPLGSTRFTPVLRNVGRPPRPELVDPRNVPRRGVGAATGRQAMLHAIAHIEFTAVNLALDHLCRFPGLPSTYYADWLGVAIEEVHHFRLLRGHLRTLGADYGDFPAHDGLSQMAEKTAGDCLARMALVPRTMEARGLDVTPGIQGKLEAAGDAAAARILDVVLADEVGHVALGDRWFRHLCAERGLPAEATYRRLLVEYDAPRLQGPLNHAARRAAGFSDEELAGLD